MKTKNRSWLPALLLVSLFCAAALNAAELLTLRDPSRSPAAGGNGDSSLPLLSADGRFVLFTSAADNLVAGTNGAPLAPSVLPQLNVFLRDRSNAATTLVSVNLAGNNGGNGPSFPAGVSSNGQYALFESSASDLFPGDDNGASDVFLRDLAAGTNILISIGIDGLPGNSDSYSAVMTPDGRFVAFASAADNLADNDTNNIPDVFVRDLLTGVTTLASVGAQSAVGYSDTPQLTSDGRFVAFFSTATNLVPGVPAGGDIYVRDLVANTTTWASSYARTALQSSQNTTNAVSFSHVISADGKFVAYEVSPAFAPTNGIVLRYHVETGLTDVISTNAAIMFGPPEDVQTLAMTPDGRFIAFIANPNNTPGLAACVYVWDALANSTTLVSGDLTGAVPTNALSIWPSITPDGRFVAFQSTATNLVTNSLEGDFHLYVRDLQTAVTRLLDAGTNGVGSGVTALTMPQLSGDGRFITFEADDGSLVANDSNQASDVFVRDVLGSLTELISRHDPVLPSLTPNGPSMLSPLAVTAEGSFVVFASDASDLVPNDTNGYRDIFVRDRLADTTLLVSADAWTGLSGNGVSAEPSTSADGRYVAFTSSATNLVAGDTNKASDVFVRDLLTDTTVLVSVNTNGFSGNRQSYASIISADGHGVLFRSSANDLVPGLPYSSENVFWRDLSQGITYVVSAYTTYPSTTPVPAAMTPDGHYIVFGTSTTVWYIWDSLLHARIYTNSASGIVLPLAISPDGNRVVFSSGTSLYFVDRSVSTAKLLLGAVQSLSHAQPHFSADSRYLAYVTSTANVPSDTNGLYDIYLYDCQTSSNTLVSQAYNAPASANGASDSPDISADGRFVAYRSAASNLVPGDFNGVPDVFLWDRVSGATLLLSLSHWSDSTADDRSLTPIFSGDGSTVVFASWASDIVPQDFNRWSDLFAVSLLSSGSIPLFQTTIISGGASGAWLSWPASLGKSYRIQFKNSLSEPTWQNLPGSVTLLGSRAYFNDLAPSVGQRFYRVIAQ